MKIQVVALCAGVLLTGASAASAQAALDDEQRIEALLAAERMARTATPEAEADLTLAGSPQAARAQPGDTIPLARLADFVGETVRVRIDNGNTRVATIESVHAATVTLRVHMTGGFARYTLERAQLRQVELL